MNNRDRDLLSNEEYFYDYRGVATGSSGATPTTISNSHAALDNLAFNESGHTGFMSDSGDSAIGDYSFSKQLEPGSKLVFTDMAHYTMVKNNTFNGINLPAIVILTKKGNFKVIRTFGYEDFKNRLS